MIGFDSFSGFILLGLIPLLFWQQRRKSRIREITVSIYPLLVKKWVSEKPASDRRLRLSRRNRLVILSLTIICLTLGINGTHLITSAQRTGTWFIVMDNTQATAGRIGDSTVLSRIRDELRSLAIGLKNRDQYTLMVTSPEPQLFSNLDKKDLLDRLKDVKPSPRTMAVDRILDFAVAVAKEGSFKKILVVSPRSMSWRESIGWRDRQILVPRDDLVLTGNAGITALEAFPAGGGMYSLYLRVSSARMTREYLDLLLDDKEGPQKKVRIDLEADGSGETYLPQIGLAETGLTLELDINDNLEEDNSLRLTGPGEEKKIHLEINGAQRRALRAAISSYERFQIGGPGGQGEDHVVRIYDKVVPDKVIEAPTLVVFPTASFDLFELKRIWTTPLRTTFHPVHPAARNGIMFRSFRPTKVLEFNVPENFQVLADAQGVPLIISGISQGHRVVLWAFDPEDNGLYLDPAFPVMLRDTISWLNRDQQVSVDFFPCLYMPSADTDRVVSGPGPDDLSCEATVKESSLISVPDLSGIRDGEINPQGTARRDLGRIFLITALIFLFILGFDRASGRGDKE